MAGKRTGDVDTIRKAEMLDTIVRGQYLRNFGAQAPMSNSYTGHNSNDWRSAPVGTYQPSAGPVAEAINGISRPPAQNSDVAMPFIPKLDEAGPFKSGSFEGRVYQEYTDGLGKSPSDAQQRVLHPEVPNAKGNSMDIVHMDAKGLPKNAEQMGSTAKDKMRGQYQDKADELKRDQKVNDQPLIVKHADTLFQPLLGDGKKE